MKWLSTTATVKKLLLITAMACLFFNALPSSAHTEQQVVFNKPIDTAQARYVMELMDKAYANLDYQLKIVEFNHPNALSAANQGTLDGQLGRVNDIDGQYENLIRVDFALFQFNLLMLTKDEQASFENIERVGLLKGYPAANAYLTKHEINAQRIYSGSIATQLNLLMQNKVDAVVILDFHLKNADSANLANKLKQRTLKQFNSYHYLHKRHQAIIPKLLHTLNDMEQSGQTLALKRKHNLL